MFSKSVSENFQISFINFEERKTKDLQFWLFSFYICHQPLVCSGWIAFLSPAVPVHCLSLFGFHCLTWNQISASPVQPTDLLTVQYWLPGSGDRIVERETLPAPWFQFSAVETEREIMKLIFLLFSLSYFLLKSVSAIVLNLSKLSHATEIKPTIRKPFWFWVKLLKTIHDASI